MNTQDTPYRIDYNVFSRGLAFKTTIDEGVNSFVYSEIQPEKTQEISKTLSKSDLKFFKDQLVKIGIDKLTNIKPPSIKHQYDGAASANLIVTYNGETYYVPAFDHGNPPKEVAAIVNRIMKLRSE